jgi:hypothetical protein
MLTIRSPYVPTLTLVDMPGLTKIATDGQPYSIVRELEDFGIVVQLHDPMADGDLLHEEYARSLTSLDRLKPADAVDRARTLAERSTELLRLGRVKIVADGSIQGFSARLRWPGCRCMC